LPQKGSFKFIKKLNRQIIFKQIQQNDGISRVELAEKTNLSPATVSNIVKELMKNNLVLESRRGKSSGGRKPILLELNPAGAYFVGLEWGVSSINAALLNLNQDLLKFKTVALNELSPDHFIKISLGVIEDFKKQISGHKKISGVGLGVHGLVDPQRGISVYAPHFKWENIPLKAMLEKKFAYPVYIDNDVRMMALTEKQNHHNDFIFINTGAGIGAAIVIADQLYTGLDFSAGEFGHMKIVEKGPLCSCGNYGCLESLVSLKYILSLYYPHLKGEKSVYSLKDKWQQMLKEARAGKKEALQLLEKTASYLGTGIGNVVNLLNPEAVVIGGAFVQAADIMLPLIEKRVARKALPVPGGSLNIEIAAAGEQAGAVGAAIRVIQEIFA